jgi:hypothetical protein
MSTILKALRRLEQEKSTRSDRPLEEAVAAAAPIPLPQAATSRRWPMIAGIAIGIVALGVAAAAAIQWSRGGAESPPIEVAAVPVEPEAPAVPGRKLAPPSDPNAKLNRSSAVRRPRPVRNSRTKAAAPSQPSPRTAGPDVAPSRPSPEPPRRTSRLPAASAAAAGSTGAQPPRASLLRPSSGESPVIDRSQIEALQAAAKSAGKSPETLVSARVAPTAPTTPPPAEPAPPAPTPKSQPKPAPVEVAVARPAPEPVPTPKVVPDVKPRDVEPLDVKPRDVEPRSVEPKPMPELKPEPELPPVRSVARKSPPRPSAPPVPKVYVSSTVWHPDASRRIAYVELEGSDETVALREGEIIGPLIVTKIAPTGVSFDNRGSELTRRVGAR